MNTGSLALDFFLLMLIVDKSWVYGNGAVNCTTAVTVWRDTKYYRNSGESATIECPVTYCQKQPKVNWYMYNEMRNEFSILHLGQGHTVSWINEKVFVLNFLSVSRNDSGLYRCEVSVDKHTIPGHAIRVIVQDHRNLTGSKDDRNTTEGYGTSGKNKMLIISILSSLGALGLLLLCCFALLQSTRRPQVKNKTIVSALQMEMNEANSCKNVTCCNDSSGHVSNEGCVLPLQLFPDGSDVYSNQSNNKKAKRAASKPTCDKCVTNQLLPANQDTLVYATLNHGEHFQRNEPSVQTEFIEYAAIVLKN